MYKFAFRNLWLKKSRTALAMVGLIIAIVGIVSLISVSAGIRYEVTSVLSKMEGVSVMQKDVMDDSMSYISLSNKAKLEVFPETSVVVPMTTGIASNFDGGGSEIKAKIMGGMVPLLGIDANEARKLPKGSLYNPDIVVGRTLKPSDKNGVLLGKSVADDYKKTVGSRVSFNGRNFKVVGIYSTGSTISDMLAVVTLENGQELTNRDSDTVSMFYVQPKDTKDADRLASKINFRYADDEFDASSSSGFTAQFGSLLSNLDAFFIGISSIALVVGAVGILNTMLMSVKERTREFGILKAVGWTSDDIVKLVLYESFFLGIIGGVIGVVTAVVAIAIAGPFIPFTLYVSAELVVYAFVVAVVLGVVGGVYPAWQAAKLDPIEAIRYE